MRLPWLAGLISVRERPDRAPRSSVIATSRCSEHSGETHTSRVIRSGTRPAARPVAGVPKEELSVRQGPFPPFVCYVCSVVPPVPEGRCENSPAIYRWDSAPRPCDQSQRDG